ncbi:BRO1-domain-containing protein [Hesseltinella vesiculosa]|uniref:BRO domain-containing protein 1 n=1 Tax=Hesseltinella vesiculosa TaxID=101127 RepID=A0A1X2GHE0_9FUNG|nr:BRO1-domain-containing protein [Hesseltinella vesiculosa]
MTQTQIPFLHVPFKRTDDIDWTRPLKRYIGQVYQQDPENYQEETYAIHRLRQDIRGAGKDLTGRDLIYRYFGQLELLDLRFPVDEKHIKVLFTWYDAFSGRPTSQYSLAFEKASVIFNLAAALSAIAASQNRTDADGRKRAFNFFQASAGMFQYINDNFLHAPSQDLHKDTVRLLADLMLAQAQECFLENSLREKKKDGLVAKLASHAMWTYGNIVDGINDAIGRGVPLSKLWLVFCQCKQKYYQALAHYHRAAACLADNQYGEQITRLQCAERLAKEAQKFTQQLPLTQNAPSSTPSSATSAESSTASTVWSSALMNFSLTSSGASTNAVSNASLDPGATFPLDGGVNMLDRCTTLAALCSEKLVVAERDNDMIYHDQVPQESILVPIDRLKAVQPIPIGNVYGPADTAKVVGPDIFARLIPLSVHESSSLYSEEKAALVRREAERCDFAKAELSTSLEYMRLPAVLNKFRTLAESQQSRSAAIQALLIDHFANPPSSVNQLARDIQSQESSQQPDCVPMLLDRLHSFWHQINASLDHVSLSLDKEMSACESLRVKHGDAWTQQPSGTVTHQYVVDLKNHQTSLASAQLSDNKLKDRWAAIASDVDLLKLGPDSLALEKLFTDELAPFWTNTAVDQPVSPMDDLQISVGLKNKSLEQKLLRVDTLLDKLDKLQKDRTLALEDLKDRTLHDDISQILLINKKNANVEKQIFATELEKFQPHQQRIGASLHEQQQCIQELTSAFKTLMDADDAKQVQTQWDTVERHQGQLTKRLDATVSTYQQVKESLKTGIKYYTDLTDAVNALNANVENFVQERTKERDTLIKTIQDTETTKEQQLLKNCLEQYTLPAVPPANNTSYNNLTSSLSANPLSSEPSVIDPARFTHVDRSLASNDFLDTSHSLRHQLEQKMKELSIAIPATTPLASNPQPPLSSTILPLGAMSPSPMSATTPMHLPPPLQQQPPTMHSQQSVPATYSQPAAPSQPQLYSSSVYSQPPNGTPYYYQPQQQQLPMPLQPQQQAVQPQPVQLPQHAYPTVPSIPPPQQQPQQPPPMATSPIQYVHPPPPLQVAPSPSVYSIPATPAPYFQPQQPQPQQQTQAYMSPTTPTMLQQPGYPPNHPYPPMSPSPYPSAMAAQIPPAEQKPMLPPKPLEVQRSSMASMASPTVTYGYSSQPTLSQKLQPVQPPSNFAYTTHPPSMTSHTNPPPLQQFPSDDFQWQQQQQQQHQQQPVPSWPSLVPQPYQPNQPSLLD